MVIIWDPKIDRDDLPDLLGCPTYGDRSPAVEAAWDDKLNEIRSILAGQLSVSNLIVPGDPDTNQRSHWEIFHTNPDEARALYADEPVYSLASRQDALGDQFLGRPGRGPGIHASDLARSVALLSALDGEDPFQVSAYIPRPDRIELLQVDYSDKQLLELATNLYRRYSQVVGPIAMDRLVNRDLEGEERVRAFEAARYWEHEVEWPSIREAAEKPFLVLRAFDAAIVAAGFIRWLRFWGEHGIGIRTSKRVSPEDLTTDLG